MKLVIKIPEKLYEAYKGRPPMLGDAGMDMIAQAIANGTPLPKGHGRLIDVSKLSYECMYENSSECDHIMCDTCQFNCVAKYEIVDAPTIIEADGGEEDDLKT